VNAIPSGNRTLSTGSRDGSKARRGIVAATGLLAGQGPGDHHAGLSGVSGRLGAGQVDRTRHAKTVCRGALSLRCAAQGRVGDITPRHVVRHLASHRLLSAPSPATSGADRPFTLSRQGITAGDERVDHTHTSRPRVQPENCYLPRVGVSDNKLVRSGRDVVTTWAFGHSGVKGVPAA
jgi:hypothetical protein